MTTELYLPALKARVGDWWYYTSSMTFSQVATYIRRPDELGEPSSLKQWIQRRLDPKRQEQVVAYLLGQPQRFFGGIIAGIYGGDPEWYPVNVGDAPGMAGVTLEERIRDAFGIIRLRGDESIFPLDGQHRVEGIKAALLADGGKELAKEEVTVIFVGHQASDEGRKRTRRLFSTLNRYARPVSKAEIVVLSEDDHFACTTRKLIDEYPGLGIEFVPVTKEANIGSADRKSLLNVVGLYGVVKAVCVPPGVKKERHWEHGPINTKDLVQFEKYAIEFWDAMKQRVPAIAAVMASKPEEEVAGRYRVASGGHFLLRPFGMTTFASAVGLARAAGTSIRQAVAKLSKLPFELSEYPWVGLTWDPVSRTMRPKHAPLVRDVMLHLSGFKPRQEVKQVEQSYHAITQQKLEKLSRTKRKRRS